MASSGTHFQPRKIPMKTTSHTTNMRSITGPRLGPTTRTGNPLVDAYLWIKRPGESDHDASRHKPQSATDYQLDHIAGLGAELGSEAPVDDIPREIAILNQIINDPTIDGVIMTTPQSGAYDDIVKKLEAGIAEGLRHPEYLTGSPGDEPVIAFMPGAEWQKRLDDMSEALRPFAEQMRASEQK